jgi:HAD superfamily hydrolase (TIGR01450 family)
VARIRSVLLDIDGVLTVSWRPLPGAIAAVRWLRDRGYPLALVTNTTSRTRAQIAGTLIAAGFPVSEQDVLTAPAVTARYLAEHHPGARCALLNSGDVSSDLVGVDLSGGDLSAGEVAAGGQGAGGQGAGGRTWPAGDGRPPDVLIVGGAGPEFSYAAMNRAFGYLRGGAALVAMHRNMYWRTDDGLRLDGGPFLLGLEQAAGVTAEVTGKPAGAFFASALTALGAIAAEAVMVGDDISSDVLAAQRCGLTGTLVRTGKYLPETERAGLARPDHVIDSVADLSALLARLR